MPTTTDEGVLALDLGSSSVRAVVFDRRGRMLEETLCQLPYEVGAAEPGEASSNPDALLQMIARSIDRALDAARKEKVAIIAVGVSCYWHSLMGVDRHGRPTTELLTWADIRSAAEARQLRVRSGERPYHARTGCFFHASFWPAKLRWLQKNRPSAVRRTARWVSLGEYLYQQLLGEFQLSISIASGTGLLDVHRCAWDRQALQLAGVTVRQLSPLQEWDRALTSLQPAFRKRWPALRDVPWFLPLGDGALANVGAGCVNRSWFCATIGTSGALRVLLDQQRLAVPWGAFVYRLDRQRYVLGGALSAGGNVVRWLTDSLGIDDRARLKRVATSLAPDGHGLTILPFWAGERSPNWRADAHAVVAGLSLSTQPGHLLRAAMESIAFQFATLGSTMERVVARPRAVVATGGGLVHTPAWNQILADALNLPLRLPPESEASSRGAALLALHALGRFPHLWSMAPGRGRTYRPRPGTHAIYEQARRRQQRLYDLVFSSAGQRSDAAASVGAGSGSKRRDPRSPAARR